MLIELKAILPDGTIIIKKLGDSGEFPEDMPVEGQQYTIYFEEVEPEKVEEFEK